MVDCDCLIVGAGPVGLLLAAELSRFKTSVRIIDFLAEPSKQTKATGIAARSMEVLPPKVCDKVMAGSRHVKQANVKEAGVEKPILSLNLETIANYHGMRAQEQWRTEQYLTEHLAELGVAVERGISLTSFDEVEGCVECKLTNSAGNVTVTRTKFLVGCDGGRSGVRKALGFRFPGEATHETFFALHASLQNFDLAGRDRMDVFYGENSGDNPLSRGFAFSMPLPGDDEFLITCDLDPEQQERWLSDEVDHHGSRKLLQPTVEDVCAVLRARGCGSEIQARPGTVRWMTHFRVNSRQAPHYGRGRVYLAGDACHCHSPLGGQGMNAGFQDAKNLGWKIAACANGWVTDYTSFLSTYEDERRSLEKLLLAVIERAQKMASARNPFIHFLRGRGARLINLLTSVQAATAVQAKATSFIAQQGWSYKNGLCPSPSACLYAFTSSQSNTNKLRVTLPIPPHPRRCAHYRLTLAIWIFHRRPACHGALGASGHPAQFTRTGLVPPPPEPAQVCRLSVT